MNNTVNYNFKPLVQGSTWSVSLVFKLNGVAVPLTNFSAQMDIREEPYPDSPLILSLTSTPAAGIVITPASGMVTLTITATQSALFLWEKAWYDIRMTNTVTGEVSVPLRGQLTVYPRITV